MSDVPIVLFGAFDRHNLGDFLLAHAAAQRAGPLPFRFAGLRAIDLTACGGVRVEAVRQVAAGWRRRHGDAPLQLVHVGGDILDTDAWEAAVMLLDPAAAAPLVARLDKEATDRAAWAANFLGRKSPAPYVLGRGELPCASRVEFRAVGGVGLAQREPGFRRAIAAALAAADRVSVRDGRTRAALAAIARARLCLASSLHAVLVAGLFGVPSVGLERRPGEGAKLRAYAETWGGFAVATPAELLSVHTSPYKR